MANILITGSSKGLGRATAIELTRRGHHVIATARKLDALAGLEVGTKLQLDVTDEASVRAAVDAAGPIDVLINNAAEIFVAPLETAPFDEIQRLYDINVFGTLRLIQAVAPQMRTREAGAIVNISSVVGKVGLPLTGIYCSTKWAIEGLSESLRIELSKFGVRVVLVEPGQIGTGALDAPRAYVSEPYAGLVREPTPRDKMSSPASIASIVADAAESTTDKFRWIAGADSEALIAARGKLDDAAFDKVVRSAMKISW